MSLGVFCAMATKNTKKISFLNEFEKDTIVAQCTPTGSGALALIRVSGPQAFSLVTQCSKLSNVPTNLLTNQSANPFTHLSTPKTILTLPSHTIAHGFIIEPQKTNRTKNICKIDEVLFFVMHAPRTFTGEHTVEISCHNNIFIIEKIIHILIQLGARLAQPGEFSRRAVENGKIDLLQAEAINELIHANSQQAIQQSLAQVTGTLSLFVHQLEKKTLKILALCEASFEFLEEEINFSDQIRELVSDLLETIRIVQTSNEQQRQLREGVRIAIIGSVNAGKSSLFNTLVGKNKAIVTPIPGTTRDLIESGLYQDGVYLTLVDTAGLRNTEDIIEKEGIERAYREAHIADLVLLVSDG